MPRATRPPAATASPATLASVTGNDHPLGTPPESPDSFTHVPDHDPSPGLDPNETTEPAARPTGRGAGEALEDEEEVNLSAQDSAFSDDGSSIGGGSEYEPLPTSGSLGSSASPAAESRPR
jgi:hypothetical protein